jgi:aminoglycoside phosphotransferase (APT) family kinase protein
MKSQIKKYFENLNPKKLGLKSKIKINSISRLGMGTGNLNYLVKINGSKFIFRLNMDPKNKGKSRKEFNALNLVEKYGISPKVLLIDESRKEFDSDFIIITYIDGKTVDKTKEYLKPKMIKQIARLCARLHTIKIRGNLNKLSKVDSINGYNQYYKSLKREYLDYINSNLKDKKLLTIIDETYKNLYLKIPKKKYNSDIVLSQGDFCEQNVIVHKNEYKLIDFEDLELTDRASHLAHLLTDFGRPFESDQKKLFLKEYFKIIKVNEEELVNKIEIWIPLKLFAVFLWSIKHVLRIKNKEMHSKFIEQDDMNNNLSYVKTMLKRNIRFEIVDSKHKNFDIVKVLNG